MGKEEVLVNARFQVVTFRGYQYCETFAAAFVAAKEMVEGIVNDCWDSSFWWARIIDTHAVTSKIVCRYDSGCFHSTPWISLR